MMPYALFEKRSEERCEVWFYQPYADILYQSKLLDQPWLICMYIECSKNNREDCQQERRGKKLQNEARVEGKASQTPHQSIPKTVVRQGCPDCPAPQERNPGTHEKKDSEFRKKCAGQHNTLNGGNDASGENNNHIFWRQHDEGSSLARVVQNKR